MSAHTPGPLFVSVEPRWPFRIITTDLAGDVVFSREMPSNSTAHRTSQEAMDGKGLPPEWNAGERNRRALADEYVRAAAPDLLKALEFVMDRLVDKHETDEAAVAARAAIAKATGGAA